ncbi:MAG: InlB B-repeat-containing protein [Oscillospiraceae bacterium]|nr:InlB B-repeat-containing protein [Oscillospiraceae bacterium]
MKKRLFAILLCLVLCISMIPVYAAAVDACEPGRHNMEEVKAKSPTCGAVGNIRYFRCRTCNHTYLDAKGETEIDNVADGQILLHTSELTYHPAAAATCLQGGTKEYWSCAECGQKFASNDRTKPLTDAQVLTGKAPHSISEADYHAPVPHSCTQDGTLAYYECEVCHKLFSDREGQNELTSIIDPARHTPGEYTAAKDPTCTEDGNIAYARCTVCEQLVDGNNAAISEADITIGCLGHDYIYHGPNNPSCTDAGNYAYYTCSRCDKVFDADRNETTWDAVTIRKVDHTIARVPAKAATCTEPGNIEYYKCDVCQKKFQDAEGSTEITDVVIPASHNLTETPAKAATCTEAGNIRYFTCTECGAILDENYNVIKQGETIVEATGHKLEKVPAKAATCTETGNLEYYRCSVCEKLFSDQNGTETTLEAVTVGRIPHTLTHVPEKAKTCTEPGNVEYYKCEVCKKLFRDAEGSTEITEVEIPASHDLEETPAKAASCTETGNIAYSTCKVCEKIFNEDGEQVWLNDTIIPALDHKPDKMEATATCTSPGYAEYYRCANCGKLFTDAACTVETKPEDLETEALGHDFDESGWCTRCGAVSPDSPAFDQSAYTSNNVIVRVSAPQGVFPGGCQLSVTTVAVTETKDAVDAERAEGATVVVSYTYDIKVLKNGEEIEPADGSLVSVSFSKMAEANNGNLDAQVYHVTDEGAQALDTTVENGAVVAVTDGFSLYTVEFTYSELQYVLPGGDSVALNEILATLNLEGTVDAGDDAVEVSDRTLFEAKKENGVWTVYSYEPFKTNEWMKVSIGGVVYEITVTDTQPNVFITNGLAWIDGGEEEDASSSIVAAAGNKVWIKIDSTKISPVALFYKWEQGSDIQTVVIDTPQPTSTDKKTFFMMPDTLASGAQFHITAEKNYIVTFHMNDHGTQVQPQYIPPTNTNKAKEPSPAPTDPDTKAEFVCWYSLEEPTKSFSFTTKNITADTDLYAKWTYLVGFSTLHVEDPEDQTVVDGDYATEPTPKPKSSGRKFLGWYKDKAKDSFKFTKTPITENMILFGKWESDLEVDYTDTKTAHYGSDYSFTLNCDYDEVIAGKKFELTLNDKEVSSSKYDLSKEKKTNYTIVTLTKEYVKSLTAGKTYKFYADPHLTDIDEVEVKIDVSSSPKTGDESNIALWAAVAAVSAVAAAVIAVSLLRRRKKDKPAPKEDTKPKD